MIVPDNVKGKAREAVIELYRERYSRDPSPEFVARICDTVLDAVSPYIWIIGER